MYTPFTTEISPTKFEIRFDLALIEGAVKHLSRLNIFHGNLPFTLFLYD